MAPDVVSRGENPIEEIDVEVVDPNVEVGGGNVKGGRKIQLAIDRKQRAKEVTRSRSKHSNR